MNFFKLIFHSLSLSAGTLTWTEIPKRFPRSSISSWSVCGSCLSSSHVPLSSTSASSSPYTHRSTPASMDPSWETARKNAGIWGKQQTLNKSSHLYHTSSSIWLIPWCSTVTSLSSIHYFGITVLLPSMNLWHMGLDVCQQAESVLKLLSLWQIR